VKSIQAVHGDVKSGPKKGRAINGSANNTQEALLGTNRRRQSQDGKAGEERYIRINRVYLGVDRTKSPDLYQFTCVEERGDGAAGLGRKKTSCSNTARGRKGNENLGEANDWRTEV